MTESTTLTSLRIQEHNSEQDNKSSYYDHTNDRGDGWQDSDIDFTDGVYTDRTSLVN